MIKTTTILIAALFIGHAYTATCNAALTATALYGPCTDCTADTATSTCATCASGYVAGTADASGCVACQVEGCTACTLANAATQCTTCMHGYSVDTNVCKPWLDGCQAYAGWTGTTTKTYSCAKCKTGYFLF